jgi:hypothetical protein
VSWAAWKIASRKVPFWDRVLRGEDCWEWQAARTTAGYGEYRSTYAHRHAYELAVGPIPRGLFVLHHCDNPPCVRPDHLWLGTNADNMRDMVAKGRGLRGSAQPMAKLTEPDIPEIRRLAASGMSRTEIGRRYGVTYTAISHVLAGRTWGWLREQPVQLRLDVAS